MTHEKFFEFLFFFLDHLLKFLLIGLKKLLASKKFINFLRLRLLYPRIQIWTMIPYNNPLEII